MGYRPTMIFNVNRVLQGIMGCIVKLVQVEVFWTLVRVMGVATIMLLVQEHVYAIGIYKRVVLTMTIKDPVPCARLIFGVKTAKPVQESVQPAGILRSNCRRHRNRYHLFLRRTRQRNRCARASTTPDVHNPAAVADGAIGAKRAMGAVPAGTNNRQIPPTPLQTTNNSSTRPPTVPAKRFKSVPCTSG